MRPSDEVVRHHINEHMRIVGCHMTTTLVQKPDITQPHIGTIGCADCGAPLFEFQVAEGYDVFDIMQDIADDNDWTAETRYDLLDNYGEEW